MSSAAQHQECKLLEASLKKGGGVFFARSGVYLSCKEVFRQEMGLFSQQGRKIAIKGPLFLHVYEPLLPLS